MSDIARYWLARVAQAAPDTPIPQLTIRKMSSTKFAVAEAAITRQGRRLLR